MRACDTNVLSYDTTGPTDAIQACHQLPWPQLAERCCRPALCYSVASIHQHTDTVLKQVVHVCMISRSSLAEQFLGAGYTMWDDLTGRSCFTGNT